MFCRNSGCSSSEAARALCVLIIPTLIERFMYASSFPSAFTWIILLNPHTPLGSRGRVLDYLSSYLAAEEMEAQRGEATCPRSHSWEVEELGLEPMLLINTTATFHLGQKRGPLP